MILPNEASLIPGELIAALRGKLVGSGKSAFCFDSTKESKRKKRSQLVTWPVNWRVDALRSQEHWEVGWKARVLNKCVANSMQKLGDLNDCCKSLELNYGCEVYSASCLLLGVWRYLETKDVTPLFWDSVLTWESGLLCCREIFESSWPACGRSVCTSSQVLGPPKASRMPLRRKRLPKSPGPARSVLLLVLIISNYPMLNLNPV